MKGAKKKKAEAESQEKRGQSLLSASKEGAHRDQANIIDGAVILAKIEKEPFDRSFQAVFEFRQIPEIPGARPLCGLDFNRVYRILQFKHEVDFISSRALVVAELICFQKAELPALFKFRQNKVLDQLPFTGPMTKQLFWADILSHLSNMVLK